MSRIKLLLLTALLLPMAACVLLPMSAESIDAQVMDADTGQPVEGANVVAYWQLSGGSIAGDGFPCGAANLEETVTDKDGKFHIPGWGPSLPGCGALTEGEPMIYVFKPGYAYGRFPNGLGNTNMLFRTVDHWRGRSMMIKPYPNLDMGDNTPNGYYWEFHLLEDDFQIFVMNMPGQCNWKKIPKMLRTIGLEEKRFNDAGNQFLGLLGGMMAADQSMQQYAPHCGSPKAFIEQLLDEHPTSN